MGVGGWTNPFEKYDSNGFHFPQFSGKNQRVKGGEPFWLPYQMLKSTWGDSAYFTPGIREETNLSDSVTQFAPENRPFNIPQKGNKRISTKNFQGKFAVGFREASQLSDHSFFSPDSDSYRGSYFQ